MTTCFICLTEDLEMNEMKCCRKPCHDKCFQGWMDYNKYSKFNNIILCPCCRTNIRDNLYVPLELHNMPLYFYLDYEKEVNHRDIHAADVFIDSDDDDDSSYTTSENYDDNDDDDDDDTDY